MSDSEENSWHSEEDSWEDYCPSEPKKAEEVCESDTSDDTSEESEFSEDYCHSETKKAEEVCKFKMPDVDEYSDEDSDEDWDEDYYDSALTKQKRSAYPLQIPIYFGDGTKSISRSASSNKLNIMQISVHNISESYEILLRNVQEVHLCRMLRLARDNIRINNAGVGGI